MGIMIQVSIKDDKLWIITGNHPLDVAKAQTIPGRRYHKKSKAWTAPIANGTFKYLKAVWGEDQVWSPEVVEKYMQAQAGVREREETLERKEKGALLDTSFLDGIPFKTVPMQHQKIALSLGVSRLAFAYLMDMGTGKTWVTINDMAIQWRDNKVDICIVLAPNSVCDQWVEQIEQHCPSDVPVIAGRWVSSPRKSDREQQAVFDAAIGSNALLFYIVNVEALAVPRCVDYLMSLTMRGNCAIAVDESTRIKNRTAKRTKNAIKIRKQCKIARILSGSPAIKSPMDLFAQFQFLDPDILGFTNFYSFRNHFGILGGYKNKQVVAYKNLEELARLIQTASYRVTISQCLELPQKAYSTRKITMTPEQRREYERMRKEMLALCGEQCGTCHGVGFIWENHDDHVCPDCHGENAQVFVTIALTQLLRLQQITSGFITDGPEFVHWFTDEPPKIIEACNIIEEAGDQSCIFWSNFRPEIARLGEEFSQRQIPYVEIHGGIGVKDRQEARRRFQEGGVHLIGHPSAGGIGLDLWRGSIATYLSNGFKTEDRVQSEARCYRRGSEVHDHIAFNDLIVPGTVDPKILRVIKQNRDLSDEIMRGGLRSMLEE
jgi:SNF2 family DNA or RNA helicase